MAKSFHKGAATAALFHFFNSMIFALKYQSLSDDYSIIRM